MREDIRVLQKESPSFRAVSCQLLVAYLAFQLQPVRNSKLARKYQLHRLEEFYQQYGNALVHQALDNNDHPELHHHLGSVIEQCSDTVALASYESPEDTKELWDDLAVAPNSML